MKTGEQVTKAEKQTDFAIVLPDESYGNNLLQPEPGIRRNAGKDCPGNHQAFTSKIIGLDKGLKDVYKQVKDIAESPLDVLILGESGTGKEVIAGLIHALSNRRDRELIALNCNEYQDTMVEAELFGYEKGAFTGACSSKPGKIEMADNSSLFLDEIGDFEPGLQIKLLRVLEEKKVARLGSHSKLPKAIDFRLIAATNADLNQAVVEKRLRSDFYYRIRKCIIDLPPLRQRRDDIPGLADYFLAKRCLECKKPLKKLDKKTINFMLDYDWPGNVRELDSEIQNAIIACGDKPVINLDCFRFYREQKTAMAAPYPQKKVVFPDPDALPTLREVKDALMFEALDRTGYNQSAAARLLGVSHQDVNRWLRTIGIHSPSNPRRPSGNRPLPAAWEEKEELDSGLWEQAKLPVPQSRNKRNSLRPRFN